MDINLIGVPLFYGCDNPGVEKGPAALRENGILDIFRNNNHSVYDLGNIDVKSVNLEDKYKDHNEMKYLSPIIETNTNLAHAIYTSLKSNNFPFTLGGDHSLGLGSLAGASRCFGDDLAVIWVDAHGDINNFQTSPSGNVHGMPLAASMNVGHPSLTNIYFKGRKIDPKKVFILCARDLDKGELDLIDSLHLNVWTTSTIKEKGVESVIEELYERLQAINVNNLHVSFDIDCVDSNLVPGTGTPVSDGLGVNEIKYLLEKILKTKKVRSMDFVEFNPIIEETTTLTTCIDILKCIAKNL